MSDSAGDVRTGVWLFPAAPAARLVDAVVAAERLGLDEVWIADEGVARDPVPVLAAAAHRTRRIRLATGITSPLLRHPGALAATAATLDELSDGRAVLGLGVGGQLSLGPFGVTAERPVAVMRDAIVTARAVLRGESADGYEPPAHAMPARDVPIWVGARGPQLVRTTARLADGLFVSGCDPQQLASIVEHAASVGGTPLAVYQSARSSPTDTTEHRWDEVVEVLRGALRHRPVSVGINLVESVDAADPVELVERAAAVLAAL